jgi:zinc/manganese transport system permease protein
MTAVVGPITGIAHMFEHPFLRYAFLAGTAIALASGLVGSFVVRRGQVFTGDALSHVAFTGALAALAFGIDLRVGLYGACVVFALIMAFLGRRARADDTVIGSVFAWILGLGALFLSIYTTSRSGTGGANGNAGVNVLFGSMFGLTSYQAVSDTVVALVVVVAMVAIGRPLLFASVDEAVASARGVPVRLLGYAFFVLLGITAGEATQAVGALMLLGLLAAPGGASQRITARPFVALWLSGAIAVASAWAGLILAYAAPRVPPSFGIVAVATATYLLAVLVTNARSSRRRRAALRAGAPTVPAPGAPDPIRRPRAGLSGAVGSE